MKKGIVITLLVAFSVFAAGAVIATAAEGPDGKMTVDVDAKVFPAKKLKPDGTKKKNPVTFDHKKHGANLGCKSCHHTQPELKAGDSKAESCFKCHGPEAKTVDGKTQADSYAIIHDKKVGKCIVCHKADEKAKTAKAPTKCKECHGGSDEE